jgi:hypothetical protein
MRTKSRFYFVELRRGKERHLVFLANAKREATLYAKLTNQMTKKGDWKAFVMPLAKLLFYFDSPEKAAGKVVRT